MKLQAINNGNSVSTKGSLHKLPQTGKFTNLAYSALFAASLLGAVDSFAKSTDKVQQKPQTEIVAGFQSDTEYGEHLLQSLQERKKQREAVEKYLKKREEEKKLQKERERNSTISHILIPLLVGLGAGTACHTLVSALFKHKR